MKKSFRKAAALALSLALVMLCGICAFAASYTPVKGDASCSFKQFLIIDKSARIPKIEFSYSITPGSAVSASAGKMAVLAGVGLPTVGKAVFAEGEEVSETAVEGVTLGADQCFAQKTVAFDFTGVSFSEPGIYRYAVTMTSSGQQAVRYDIQKGSSAEEKKRVLDVYVIDDGGVLKVDSYAFHELASDVSAGSSGGSADVSGEHARLADKSEGFVNRYATRDLTFGKEVTGNQGSKDKYFEFTFRLSGAEKSAAYMADISAAETASGSTEATIATNRGKTNPASFTTDASGAASVKYYLCDGQYVTVKGLPEGSAYEITENREDYVQTEGIDASIARGGTAHTDPLSGTIAEADVRTGFTNTRNGIVPTGIILAAAPGAGAAVLGLGGIAVILAAGKRRGEKDDQDR